MDKFDVEVINTIRELGIPAHVKGYEFIKTAMNYFHKNPNSIYAVTKDLYPEVAKLHKTTWTRVERGIRHAISISRADDDAWVRVLGRTGPIPNGEFLATLNAVVKMKLVGVV